MVFGVPPTGLGFCILGGDTWHAPYCFTVCKRVFVGEDGGLSPPMVFMVFGIPPTGLGFRILGGTHETPPTTPPPSNWKTPPTTPPPRIEKLRRLPPPLELKNSADYPPPPRIEKLRRLPPSNWNTAPTTPPSNWKIRIPPTGFNHKYHPVRWSWVSWPYISLFLVF